MAVSSTRLRSIRAKTLAELEALVEGLPFKVEIKYGPAPHKGGWFVSFVIPDEVDQFLSVGE